MAVPAILGMGNPLLDISVEVPDLALASKYGLKMGDACLATEAHQPLYKELVESFKDSVQYIGGGATQNSIRVAQWVSGEPAGYAAFVGAVGADEFGKQLRACAEADGVAALYQVNDAKPTGTCAVIVHEKERSLCANLVAAETLAAAHLETPAVAAAVDSARIIYNAGFPLTHEGGNETALQLAKHAAAKGKIYCVNLSAPFICQFFKDRLAGVLHYADFVFGNETEAAAWGATNGLGETATVEEVALAVSALPKASGTRGRVVIITQGSKATVIAEGGSVRSIPVEPIPAEAIVDSNGAGDAFVGGFLASIAKGAAIDAAVKVGSWAAGHVIQHSGCVFDRAARPPTF